MTTLVALAVASMLQPPAACESLRTLVLPNTTITLAELVSEGPFRAPAAGGRRGGPGAPSAPPFRLPAHCRVAAVLTPSSDSHIEIEVWMPAENWNGKFQAVGNGGWGGVFSFSAMAAALQEGYATASTDTGHKGFDALFAIDHPEKLVDFAHRAVHEMTVKAKALIAAYYNRGPRLSYWNGCSTGGRQGLMAAQKYPEDFDAIIAGAPANAPTHQNAWTLSVSVPVMKDPSSAVPAAKLAMVTRAVLNACDARDGVSDGVLNDPAACRFDVASLQCKTADNIDCLTSAQVTAMKRAYEPARTGSGRLVSQARHSAAKRDSPAFWAARETRKLARVLTWESLSHSVRSKSRTTTRGGIR